MIKRFLLWIIKKYDLTDTVSNLSRARKQRLNEQKITNKGGRLLGSCRIDNQQGDSNNIVIGKGTVVAGILQVFSYGGQIIIGDYCYVGEGTRIWSGESVKIGNNVFISHNVNIMDTDSHELNPYERERSYQSLQSLGNPKLKGNVNTAVITIEDHVWIGFNAIILKGVKIGKGAIIASGALITRDVDPFNVMGGNPARVLKALSNEDRED